MDSDDEADKTIHVNDSKNVLSHKSLVNSQIQRLFPDREHTPSPEPKVEQPLTVINLNLQKQPKIP